MLLIYLAAGRGSRLPKKFRENPKCLTKINGITIFEKILNSLISLRKKLL